MKRHAFIMLMASSLVLVASIGARADRHLSPEMLDQYDREGYFTPNFKQAIRDLVESRETLDKALAEQQKFQLDLPGLEQQAADAQAKTVALHLELAKYDHPEDNDFTALQAKVKDPAATPDDIIELAQAYVWTYPTSPHEVDAQQYLNTWQKKLADQQQAAKDADAAKVAAHAEMVRRAQTHDLSLVEWRDFLRGMSQDDIVKLFGQPNSKQNDYWFYEGGWVVNPANSQKSGLQINFEAGRVLGVDAKPATP